MNLIDFCALKDEEVRKDPAMRADECIKRCSELLDEIDETFKRIDKKMEELREHLECFGGNK